MRQTINQPDLPYRTVGQQLIDDVSKKHPKLMGKDIAKRVAMHKSHLSRVTSQGAPLSTATVRRICKKFDLNEEVWVTLQSQEKKRRLSLKKTSRPELKLLMGDMVLVEFKNQLARPLRYVREIGDKGEGQLFVELSQDPTARPSYRGQYEEGKQGARVLGLISPVDAMSSVNRNRG